HGRVRPGTATAYRAIVRAATGCHDRHRRRACVLWSHSLYDPADGRIRQYGTVTAHTKCRGPVSSVWFWAGSGRVHNFGRPRGVTNRSDLSHPRAVSLATSVFAANDYFAGNGGLVVVASAAGPWRLVYDQTSTKGNRANPDFHHAVDFDLFDHAGKCRHCLSTTRAAARLLFCFRGSWLWADERKTRSSGVQEASRARGVPSSAIEAGRNKGSNAGSGIKGAKL